MNFNENNVDINYFLNLPIEILLIIFEFCNSNERKILRKVSKYFRFLIDKHFFFAIELQPYHFSKELLHLFYIINDKYFF